MNVVIDGKKFFDRVRIENFDVPGSIKFSRPYSIGTVHVIMSPSTTGAILDELANKVDGAGMALSIVNGMVTLRSES